MLFEDLHAVCRFFYRPLQAWAHSLMYNYLLLTFLKSVFCCVTHFVTFKLVDYQLEGITSRFGKYIKPRNEEPDNQLWHQLESINPLLSSRWKFEDARIGQWEIILVLLLSDEWTRC
jgi:hypothetical protein